MTSVIPLAGHSAAASPLPSTPELVGLHAQAENSLCAALHELRRMDATPATLRRATARATRAGTLLRRACESLNTVEG